MNQKNEHAIKPDTWFGLNKPEAKATDVDAVIFGIPYDGGVSYRGGAAQAPDLLRANTDHATPCTERLDYFDDFAVLDAGKVLAPAVLAMSSGMDGSLVRHLDKTRCRPPCPPSPAPQACYLNT